MNDEAPNKVVLIHGGGNSIGLAVIEEFLRRGATVALHDAARPETAAAIARDFAGERVLDLSAAPLDEGDIAGNLAAVAARCGRLDALINLYVPGPGTGAAELETYAPALYRRDLAAAEILARPGGGMIVNQFYLASSFADTDLGDAVAAARGAITGITRTLCIRYGRMGVRVIGLLVGLLDAPEIKALASERVRAATTPLRRWAEPVDIAKSVAFLVLDSGYISGQMLIMDGGLTAGINGT
ncbi:MAG TPA: SDR family oxidoreductase [Candidatus Competibacter sp.]|nr:SDR family oxidoreductase [Candidatus Competibacter sp.]HUM95576.1 SDR family oxidoreductase [Candidatus Competibacter sp.]